MESRSLLIYSVFFCFLFIDSGVFGDDLIGGRNRFNFAPLNGDIRIRHEQINYQGDDKKERETLQLRIGSKLIIDEDSELIFRAATNNKKDPTNRSVVLNDNYSSSNLYLDQLYFKFMDEYAKREVWIGRMPNLLTKTSDLLWDDDLTFDGLGLKGNNKGDLDLDINAGLFTMDRRSSEADLYLCSIQVVNSSVIGDYSFKNAVSSNFFLNAEGHSVAYTDKSYGNEVYIDEGSPRYGNDFNILNISNELTYDLYQKPLVLSLDYINNIAVGEEEHGYLIGFKFNKVQDNGDLSFGYSYRYLQSNSAVGKFTDSDSFGGGTNGRGNKFFLETMFSDYTKFKITYYLNNKNEGDGSYHYKRLQADLTVLF